MKSARRVSIRWRLTALVVASAALASVIAISALIATRMLDARLESDRKLGQAAALIGDLITPALQSNNVGLAQHTIDAAVGRFDATSIRIYRHDGTPLVRTPPSAADRLLADTKVSLAENRDRLMPNLLIAVVPIIDDLDTLGYVAIDANPPAASTELAATIRVGMVALAVGIAAAWVLIAWAQGSRLRVIRQLALLSSELTPRHNATAHVQKHVSDEIGDLVDGFNHMLDQIGLRDLSIERHRRDVDRVLAGRRILQVDKSVAQAELRRQATLLTLIGEETRAPLHEIIDATTRLGVLALSTEQSRIVQIVQSRTHFLLQMLANLSALAGPTRSAAGAERVDFEPRALLEAIVDTFAERAHAGNVDIIWHVDTDVPRVVRGDATGMRQVLSTLVANAVNGTELGHVTLVVCTHDRTARPIAASAPSAPRLLVNVQCIGPGMLDAAGPHADRFGGEVGKPNGAAGLAIAIAKHQAMAFGGLVDHAHIPGAGVEASISIPIEPASHDAPPEQRVTPPMRVLLIEASRAMREILARRLESMGLTVSTAFGIGSACELLTKAATRDQPFDCVIVSAHDEGDGFDGWSRGLGTHAAIANIPLILLARRQMVVPDGMFGLGGGVMVLRMPLRNEELLRCIQQIQEIAAKASRSETARAASVIGHDEPSRHLAESTVLHRHASHQQPD